MTPRWKGVSLGVPIAGLLPHLVLTSLSSVIIPKGNSIRIIVGVVGGSELRSHLRRRINMPGLPILYGLETYELKLTPYMGDSLSYECPLNVTSFHNGEYQGGGEWCRVEDVIELLKLRGVIQ